MAVFSVARAGAAPSGIQPFEARRHMRQVADLIGDAFAGELDANGREMVEEMRLVAWLSPFLGSLASFAFFDDVVSGFVWLERGVVVGNVTFQRADYSGMRWRISNVAVASDFRNRGIGRALMQQAIREIAEERGAWGVLQVRADNTSACHLYESLGFSPVCREGVWKLPILPPRLPEPDAEVELRPMAASAWRVRSEVARAARTSLADWLEPFNEFTYQIGMEQRLGEAVGRLVGLRRVARWGAWDGDRLLGWVETAGGWMSDRHRLRLVVHPQARGRLERTLVAQGLRSLAVDPVQPVVAEHDGDHVEGVAALEAAGFRRQRVLLTMRRQVTGKDG